MRFRSIALFAALLFVAPAALAPVPAQAQLDPIPLTTEELMRATALDEIFTQFGPVIEASPLQQPVPFNDTMLAAWQGAVREVFDADAMHTALATTLADKFTHEDYQAYAAFYRSPFGEEISRIEHDVTVLGPESQEAARADGLVLAAEADARRHEQIEEMLVLVSAELATAMVRQSVRGMLIGMSMVQQQGDIQVPWEEIDAHIESFMPGIEADVAITQRAMMFYGYRDLSEADLDHYLDFLRTDAARKFYAIAAYSVGEIVAERMTAFGETLATNLGRVNI